MRLLKRFIVLAAGVAAAAALGSPAAQAEGFTSFCKVNEGSFCVAGLRYGEGTKIEASTNNIVTLFLTASFKIECKHSKLSLELEQALANPLKALNYQYDFLECVLGIWNCTVTAEVPNSISFLREEGLKGVGTGTGEMLIFVNCPPTGKCTIVASPFTLRTFGTTAEAAKLWVQEVPFVRTAGGITCPKEWAVDSILEITSPTPLYISS